MSKDAKGDIQVSPCLKWFLFSVNFLFWILSVLLILNALYQLSLRDSTGLDVIASSEEVKRSDENNAEAAVAYILVYLIDVSWTFLCVGGILFVVTLVGFLGALRENRVCLVIYDFMLCILIAAKTGGLIYFFYTLTIKSKPADVMRKMIKFLVNKYHRDFRIDLILDWIQSYFECCGTTVPGDTALGHNPWNIWHRHPDYECDQRLRTQPFYCSVPPSCCKNPLEGGYYNPLCGKDVITVGDGAQPQKFTMKPSERAYKTIFIYDCAEKVGGMMSEYLLVACSVCAGLILAQVIALWAAEKLKGQILKCRISYEADTARLRLEQRNMRWRHHDPYEQNRSLRHGITHHI